MTTSKPFRRVDKAILNALIQLVSEIPFEKITVQHILEEALISRYTFYAHFRDKYEVAERLQEELYQEFLTFMRKKIPELYVQDRPPEDHHRLIDALAIQFAKAHYAKIQAIKKIRTDTVDYFRLIKQYFIDHYKERFRDSPHVELESRIYANMVTAVVEYYTDNLPTAGASISESVLESYIHAMLYGIGIHEAGAAAKAQSYLTSLIYKPV